MALQRYCLELLNQVLLQVKASNLPRKILSLGYPDLMLPHEDIAAIFNCDASQLKIREDSDVVKEYHRQDNSAANIVDTTALFELLGFEFDCLDCDEIRGGEIVTDLNHPVDEKLHQQYTVIIDPGTLEHCFNIGTAIMNVANLVCIGGFVIHSNPINFYNHGFYNFSPTFYFDFYHHNGFIIDYLKCSYNDKKNNKAVLMDIKIVHSFSELPNHALNLVVVHKVKQQILQFPIQFKYRYLKHGEEALQKEIGNIHRLYQSEA